MPTGAFVGVADGLRVRGVLVESGGFPTDCGYRLWLTLRGPFWRKPILFTRSILCSHPDGWIIFGIRPKSKALRKYPDELKHLTDLTSAFDDPQCQWFYVVDFLTPIEASVLKIYRRGQDKEASLLKVVELKVFHALEAVSSWRSLEFGE